MTSDTVELPGVGSVPVYSLNTIIVGSGAAGLNCAEHLYDYGCRDIAIVTDQLGAGTSNNSGSDKQTYYKLGVFGDAGDSPMDLARTLTAGGMCHGDIAYVEAACSAQEFFHLVKNGVPFPCDRYGAYIGYKTDHDPRRRGTSAGPKTSWLMVGKSLENIRRNGTQIFDGYKIVELLTIDEASGRRVIGAVAINKAEVDTSNYGLVIFSTQNVVLATGGPGEIYADSVYPVGQVGSLGLALRAGAVAQNLTESQFGLASVGFRWNLSGSYQQAVPSYFAADSPEGERSYFLDDYFVDLGQQATNIFLKGYQWPVSAARARNMGSSLVDIAVHQQRQRGLKVYMDFTQNPGGDAFSLDILAEEAQEYLLRCGATAATPYERLVQINPAAIQIYEDHGVDLRKPLPVAVCAQHCNGGVRADTWWETDVPHLFAIGEVCGTHGVRPGGSALNAGQVGGLRAAQYIANRYADSPMPLAEFVAVGIPRVQQCAGRLDQYRRAPGSAPAVGQVRHEIQQRMTQYAGFLREAGEISDALAQAWRQYRQIHEQGMRVSGGTQLLAAVENEELCLAQLAFLEALDDYVARGGGSRGSYLILDAAGECEVTTRQGTQLRHRAENEAMREEILEVRLADDGTFQRSVSAVRPIPDEDPWFETTWRQWQLGEVFDK